jgi:hypothetical protein
MRPKAAAIILDRLMQAEGGAAIVIAALMSSRSAEVTNIHLRPFAEPQ